MLKRTAIVIYLALISAILPPLSIGAPLAEPREPKPAETYQSSLVVSRVAHLRHGVNLSHWFAQASEYSKTHLDSHTTAEDIALIESMGFDHVRFTVEPAPLMNPNDPGVLNSAYLRYFDAALDMILSRRLAVIVDIHPSDEFKLRLKDDRQVEAFARFWSALAQHLSVRDPERVFLELLNEPMVEDGYRWYGIQGRLIAAVRAAAPQHTIIVSGHRWSGLAEMLFMQPYSDQNLIYNFHYYDPFSFTHQGATWAGPNLPFYKNVPYPSSPEAVAKILDTIPDEPARFSLMRYGEERWDASRLDREIAVAAAWGAKYHVPVTCNEFGAFRKVVAPEARSVWIRDMRTALENHGIGWTMWDYAGGFSVVNKTGGHATADQPTLSALGLSR